MSYFDLSCSFGNKRHLFPFKLICELASEADKISTMQSGFSGLFVQPLPDSVRVGMKAITFADDQAIGCRDSFSGLHEHVAAVVPMHFHLFLT